MVLGQAVTGGSTPKATLFELALFRRFFTISLLTESYGESVAFGALENEEDSNRDKRCQSLKPNHHGPHDSPRIQSGPDTVKEIEVRRTARVMDWGVQRGMWYDLSANAKSPECGNLTHGWNQTRNSVTLSITS